MGAVLKRLDSLFILPPELVILHCNGSMNTFYNISISIFNYYCGVGVLPSMDVAIKCMVPLWGICEAISFCLLFLIPLFCEMKLLYRLSKASLFCIDLL
jgi:hypothetical protein